MTATLVITGLEDSVVERVKIMANAKNRTVEQQVRVMIEDQLSKSEPFDRIAFAEVISAMTPVGVQQSDSMILLREDRARDDYGLRSHISLL